MIQTDSHMCTQMMDVDSILSEPLSFLRNPSPITSLDSIDRYGILSPLHIIKFRNQYLLLDGYVRLNWAKDHCIHKVPVVCHDSENKGRVLFDIIRAIKSQLSQSPLIQAQLFKYLSLHIDYQLTVSDYLPSNMSEHSYLKSILYLSKLDDAILAFCQAKQFSYTHCKKLSLCLPEVLSDLVELDPKLQWSASSFLIATSYFINKRKIKVTIKSLFESFIDTCDQSKFESSVPKVRQQMFLLFLKEYHRPELSYYHDKISRYIDSLNLDKSVSIEWDKSLELHEFVLKLKCFNKGELYRSLSLLDADTCHHIDGLLDYL